MQKIYFNKLSIKTNNLKNKENKSVKNISIIILASIISSLNVLFFNNYSISLIIVALELIILVYYFMKKDITNYLGNYLIFLCLSFEFDTLIGTEQFYGFKNFRIFGVNLGIITLLPILILAIYRKVKIRNIKNDFNKIYKFSVVIIFMQITGFIFGLFEILINDNNVQNMEGMLSSFIGVSYNMIAIPFLMIVSIVYILTWEKEKIPQLERYLIAILIGVVVSMIVSLITKNFGTYGGVDTLLVTYIIQYLPFMVLFPFYKSYKSEKSILIFGCLGAVLSLMYNATGKIIILYLLMIIGVYIMLWKTKRFIPLILAILVIPIVIILGTQAIGFFASNSVLFNSKLTEALSMFKFWSPDWIINMPLSPRTRIIELIGVIYEYLTKPWFFLFGKGYMGTIKDYTGLLGQAFVPGAFSNEQWFNGTFYALHGTINILFLYNGLFGLSFYLYMIKEAIMNFSKNPWILIGCYWVLLFYGFSVTISTFGITALLLGYAIIDIENSKSVK